MHRGCHANPGGLPCMHIRRTNVGINFKKYMYFYIILRKIVSMRFMQSKEAF